MSKKELKRSFAYDEASQKFQLRIESEIDIKDGEKTVGVQKQIFEQFWDPEHIASMFEDMEKQHKEITTKQENIRTQMKEIGRLTDREKQKLKVLSTTTTGFKFEILVY